VTFEGLTSAAAWSFRGPDGDRRVPIRSRLVVNTADSVIAAALRGVGITRLMSYQMADLVADGSLKRLLVAYEAEAVPVSLLYARQGRLLARMRVFLELTAARLTGAMGRKARFVLADKRRRLNLETCHSQRRLKSARTTGTGRQCEFLVFADSCRWPARPSRRKSAPKRACELAVPAMTRPCRRARNSCRGAPTKGRFSASNLNPTSPGLGHKPSFPTRSKISSRSIYEWLVSREETDPHFGSTRPVPVVRALAIRHRERRF
jgi:hypothetical protein